VTRQSPGPTPAELVEHARTTALEQIEAADEKRDRERAEQQQT
jgi:hypothetical protein